MKTRFFLFGLIVFLNYTITYAQEKKQSKSLTVDINTIEAFKDTLNQLSKNSDNDFFKMHCNSIITVIESKKSLLQQDTSLITETYNAFNNSVIEGNAKILSSYLGRKRPFILSWQSPADSNISFSWLKVPKDWNPEEDYPLYIELHGLWSVANNSIEYLTYPYRSSASSSFAFEDGYLLSPWGRGNIWYQGISETDIWESIDALKTIVKINSSRQYLCGHSMGGYGAWSIGSKSPETWAALGIHAGALWYNNSSLVTNEVVNKLKDVPTYFVCGTQDGLLTINQTAYHMLQDAGNYNTSFVTFTGGHDYIEENVENMYVWMKDFVNEDWNDINEQTIPEPHKTFVYPNPFNKCAEISYNIKSASVVKIEIINQNGQVLQILRNDFQVEGEYKQSWTPDSWILSGLYFLRISKTDEVETMSLLYIKN